MKSNSDKESKKKLIDKCSNCGSTKSDSYWDYEDNTVLCEKCHSELGKEWQTKLDEKKAKKKESKEQDDEKIDPKLKGVDGWLGFFIFGLCVSILINLFFGIKDIADITALQIPSGYMAFLVLIDILLYGGLIGFIIYTIYSLTKIKNNAVSVARKYLIFMIVASICSLILEASYPSLYTQESSLAGGSARGLIFGLIWLGYFGSSKRVKITYPESKRKSTLLENIWFYSLLLIQIIVFILGLMGGAASVIQ